jgi:Na+/H+-dicarboxylate symporter
MNEKTYFWTAVLLAIILGIVAGACHAYSVASHKTVGDTFNGVITREVTQ